jgi:formylglycine-generating enzyme required for sulfatase activity
MKFRFPILIMFFSAIAGLGVAQHAHEPLNKNQVMDLVKGGMETPELLKLIREHGVDFDLTDDYLRWLRQAGAEEPVIQALRAARPKPLSREQVLQLVVGHVPNQRATSLVRQHGIDFPAGEEYLKTLRLAGADEELIAALREASKAPRLATGVRVNPKDGLKYVWIPPGTFMMGCSPGDNECFDWERPSHQVTITRGFWIGQTPVTVGAYKRFAGSNGRQNSRGRNNNDNMPIVVMSWDDAQAYCRWIGGRLPTEAEWEFAARGGSTEARYGPLDEIAWYHNNSGGQWHEVAQKLPNGFALYDMLGNVWEFVNDWQDENYYQSSPSQDPQGPAGGDFHVLRGGSAYDVPRDIRVSARMYHGPVCDIGPCGFRCGGEVFAP